MQELAMNWQFHIFVEYGAHWSYKMQQKSCMWKKNAKSYASYRESCFAKNCPNHHSEKGPEMMVVVDELIELGVDATE